MQRERLPSTRRPCLNPTLPDLDALAQIVRKAGAIVMTIYNSGFDVRSKADATPVTEADERAERPRSRPRKKNQNSCTYN